MLLNAKPCVPAGARRTSCAPRPTLQLLSPQQQPAPGLRASPRAERSSSSRYGAFKWRESPLAAEEVWVRLGILQELGASD